MPVSVPEDFIPGALLGPGTGPRPAAALPASLVEEPEVVSLCSLGTLLRFAMHWLLSSWAQGSSQKNEVPAPAHLPPTFLPPLLSFPLSELGLFKL